MINERSTPEHRAPRRIHKLSEIDGVPVNDPREPEAELLANWFKQQVIEIRADRYWLTFKGQRVVALAQRVEDRS